MRKKELRDRRVTESIEGWKKIIQGRQAESTGMKDERREEK